MRRLTCLLAVLVMLSGGFTASAQPVALSGRQVADLDSGWRFLRSDSPGAENPGFDDSGWPVVNLPHTWNALDGEDGGGDYYRGDGWYRRTLWLPPGSQGRRSWLEFDGANTVTDVWVNGRHLGTHSGGYARFRFDATAAIEPGRANVV